MTTTTMKGSPRKTLATQLDRLDNILDGLAEAIPEAVALSVRQAVTDAVRLAVREAVKEALAHPDLAARLAPPQPAPVQAPPAKPTIAAWERVKEAGRHALARCAGVAEQAAAKVASARTHVNDALKVAWAWRKPLAVAAGVGAAACAVAAVAGPTVSAVMSGTCSFALSLAASSLAAGKRLGGLFS